MPLVASASRPLRRLFVVLLIAPGLLSSNGKPATGDRNSPLGKLDAPDLRYRILEHFGMPRTRRGAPQLADRPEVWFCDPDMIPAPNSVREKENESKLFPEIEGDQETFRAIANHLGLAHTVAFSDEQKLLVYREFKKLRGAVRLESSDHQFRFSIGVYEKTGNFRVEGLIDRDGKITVLKRQATFLGCPKCLAENTKIDTPTGPVSISDVRKDMMVWTQDAAGHRVIARILAVSAVPAPPSHRMVHIILKDGRELFASPQHPTMDGHAVGQLRVGLAYDGSVVQHTELIDYKQPKTYDLLPDGETGFYWANGILLASTLR